MSTTALHAPAGPDRSERRSTSTPERRLAADPAYQAFWLLRIGFTVAPLAFGLDKFFNVLVHWESYLASWINDIIPGNAFDAMHLVGVVEIAAGVLVAVKPRYGAYVVAA